MTSIRFSRMIMRGLLAGGALCIAFSLSTAAQVQTSQTVAEGKATKQVKVERGEVVYVSGNDLVVKMEDGSLQHFSNVPDDRTVTVDGKQLNVHQLQPGMKLERQTVTTSTPRMVTTIETVTGKVWNVMPPTSVTLTLENGKNQTFKIPKGQKFTIDGQTVDAFALKKGMNVSAQRVTEVPETVVSQEIKRSGTMPPPPPPPKADLPILVVEVPALEEAAATEPAPTKLPKTASNLPLIGLLGALFCTISLFSMTIRKVLA